MPDIFRSSRFTQICKVIVLGAVSCLLATIMGRYLHPVVVAAFAGPIIAALMIDRMAENMEKAASAKDPKTYRKYFAGIVMVIIIFATTMIAHGAPPRLAMLKENAEVLYFGKGNLPTELYGVLSDSPTNQRWHVGFINEETKVTVLENSDHDSYHVKLPSGAIVKVLGDSLELR